MAQTGLLVPGNIDLTHRPRVPNMDGSVSTVRSISVNMDGREVLLPTVTPDGRMLTPQEAIAEYRRTGKHLGMFDTPAHATAYAEHLHQQQAKDLTGPQWPGPQPSQALIDAIRSVAGHMAGQGR